MAEFPALNFYSDAYLADTAHLSIAEAGAYSTLLFVSWRIEDGGLPNDDRILARYARATTKEWKRVKPAVMSFWTLCDDGKWRQKRLELERTKARAKAAKSAASARLRWLKENEKHDADASKTQAAAPCESDATTSTSTSNDTAVVSARVLDAVRAVWPDLDCRTEFMGLTASLGMVESWSREGADLDRDILPTIRRLCVARKNQKATAQGPPRSFAYFAQAVADAKATNESPLPHGQPAPERSARQPAYRNGFVGMAAAGLYGAGNHAGPEMDVSPPDPDYPAHARAGRRLVSRS